MDEPFNETVGGRGRFGYVGSRYHGGSLEIVHSRIADRCPTRAVPGRNIDPRKGPEKSIPIHARIELYGAAVGSLSVYMIAPGSSTACVALGALRLSISSSSCRQEDKLSNDGCFVLLRLTEAELACLGASPFSLGASPCKACSPPFLVDFIVFSWLFRVLFVLPVGLARLDVFPLSFHRYRLECSWHPS